MCEYKLSGDCGRIDVTFADKICTATIGNVNGMTSQFLRVKKPNDSFP